MYRPCGDIGRTKEFDETNVAQHFTRKYLSQFEFSDFYIYRWHVDVLSFILWICIYWC